MILPFPTHLLDWVAVWRQTKTMTLLSSEGKPTTIPIFSVEEFHYDSRSGLVAVKVMVTGGCFFISLMDGIEALKDQLTYYMSGNNPKQGRWNIPEWYIERHDSQTRDE